MNYKTPIVFFAVLILQGTLIPVMDYGAALSMENDFLEDETSLLLDGDDDGYIVREPLRINGNSDFVAQATAEGWSGDGTEGNPYIIEGYEINGTSHGHGIDISNTNVHFVIRNCYVYNVSKEDSGSFRHKSGIYLYKVKNGLVENNVLLNNTFSIHLDGSNNNVIDSNMISTPHIGILSRRYDQIIINNNSISYSLIHRSYGYGLDGISISSTLASNHYTITNNNILPRFQVGISITLDFDDEMDFVIENNTFENVSEEINVGYASPSSSSIGFAFATVAILTALCFTWKKKRRYKGDGST
ncbi:MAG: NosD domain-containing protein [Thermoplasmata archaeon]